jgi:carbamoyl-phosphate synthase large subunit
MVQFFNILFTCVGRRVSLIRHFRRALAELNVPGKLLGVDATDMAPAFHVLDKGMRICPIADDDYITCLLRLCKENGVKLLIPLLDTELPELSMNRERFAEVGTLCLVSDPKVVEIARDKTKTCQFFQKIGVDTPEIMNTDGESLAQARYPLFVKPVNGSASIGARRILSHEELLFHLRRYPNSVVTECLEGEEYTIDVLTDLQGRARCAVPRLRIEVRAGEVSKGMTVKNRSMMEQAKVIIERLPGCRGPITLQCFLTEEGRLAFTEINPRFGGGHPLAIAAGADFPKWILQLALGIAPDISLDGFIEGLVMLRYDAEILVRWGENVLPYELLRAWPASKSPTTCTGRRPGSKYLTK